MTRQPLPQTLFHTKRAIKPRGATVGLHSHNESQLIFAASGTVQVYTTQGRWLVPPQLAVWIPAGVPHRTEVLFDTDLWMIYCHPSVSQNWAQPASLERAFALRVTVLLRELIFAAFAETCSPGKSELIVRLLLHELTETQDAPTFLPLPASAIGRRVAELALADASNVLDLGELAQRAATSLRTISRLFPTETGLTFKAWRQRARIVLAIDRLSAGNPISQVASHAGFASTAAFCFAFRQVTRMTPGHFLDHATGRQAHRAARSFV
jgi:AraC-like DNA-binding protein